MEKVVLENVVKVESSEKPKQVEVLQGYTLVNFNVEMKIIEEEDGGSRESYSYCQSKLPLGVSQDKINAVLIYQECLLKQKFMDKTDKKTLSDYKFREDDESLEWYLNERDMAREFLREHNFSKED